MDFTADLEDAYLGSGYADMMTIDIANNKSIVTIKLEGKGVLDSKTYKKVAWVLLAVGHQYGYEEEQQDPRNDQLRTNCFFIKMLKKETRETPSSVVTNQKEVTKSGGSTFFWLAVIVLIMGGLYGYYHVRIKPTIEARSSPPKESVVTPSKPNEPPVTNINPPKPPQVPPKK